jgi:hypothetical protein
LHIFLENASNKDPIVSLACADSLCAIVETFKQKPIDADLAVMVIDMIRLEISNHVSKESRKGILILKQTFRKQL